MKEPYSEGVANHADLESCGGGRDLEAEALTEALAGGLLSREETQFGGRPSALYGEATPAGAPPRAAVGCGAVIGNLARLETPRTRTGTPGQRSVGNHRQAVEGQGRTTRLYVEEESDRVIVPTKAPNNGGEPSAEVLGGRTRAKENDDEPRKVRTQRRADRDTEAVGVRRGGFSEAAPHVTIQGGRMR